MFLAEFPTNSKYIVYLPFFCNLYVFLQELYKIIDDDDVSEGGFDDDAAAALAGVYPASEDEDDSGEEGADDGSESWETESEQSVTHHDLTEFRYQFPWDRAVKLTKLYIQRLQEFMAGLETDLSQEGQLEPLSQAHHILTKDRNALVAVYLNCKKLDE